MCGRSRVALAPQRIEQATGVPQDRWVDRERYQPSYNVSPGAWTPILRHDEQQEAVLQTMRWGLVPSFTKPGSQLDFYKMFNARSESVAEKPVFSRLLSSHRCVVITEGFYEWKTDAGGKKQPYFISFGEGAVLFMAGLYDVYAGGPEGPMATYTILTADSSPRLAWLHDRMPVLLTDKQQVEAWLAGKDQKPQVAPLQLCAPCNSEAIVWHPVTAAMNKASYQKPDASADVRKKKGAITSFFKTAALPAKPKAAAQPASEPTEAEAAKPISKQTDGATAERAGEPRLGNMAQAVHARHAVKQEVQQQQQRQAPETGDGTGADVRNPDEESGPSAGDEVAAAAAAADSAAALGPKNTAQPHNAAAAAAATSAAAPEAAGAGVSGKRQHSDVDASGADLRSSMGKKPKR